MLGYHIFLRQGSKKIRRYRNMRALIYFLETGEIHKVIDEDTGQEIDWEALSAVDDG